MVDKLLKRKEVEQICGISCATIYKGIANGSFPKPVKIGSKSVRWPESVIADWLAGLRGESVDAKPEAETKAA